jgi:hypothetical protein
MSEQRTPPAARPPTPGSHTAGLPSKIEADPETPAARLPTPGSHTAGLPSKIEADPETVGRDLGRLVLTLVELIRQLMERQALRRVEVGDLPDETVERLGLGLMRLEEAMAELRTYFGLRPEDLNIDLGPLGNLLPPPPRP